MGALHSTRTGPTTSAPTASPSHHVNQIAGYSRQLAFPLSVRLLAPIVAPTVVLKSPASTTNLKTSRERLKTSRPFAKSLTDRKSTRLNSSHTVKLVCRLLLEKKKQNKQNQLL